MFSVRVGPCESGLLFCDGQFAGLLPSGRHRVWWPWRMHVEVVNRLEPRLVHAQLETLLRDAAVRAAVDVVELAAHERMLVWQGDRLVAVVGAGRHAFWREPCRLRFELRDAREGRLVHARLDAVVRLADACTLFRVVNVGAGERVEVTRDGVLVETLEPGSHVFWQAPAGMPTFAFQAVAVGVARECEPRSHRQTALRAGDSPI